METKPNDQAFADEMNSGLTKREYFAIEIFKAKITYGRHLGYAEDTAKTAIAFADILIKKLNQKIE